MTTTAPTERSEYVAGLRALADMLERHEDVPLPFTGTPNSRLDFYSLAQPETVAEAAAFARAFPGQLDKSYTDGGTGGGTFRLHGVLGGLHVAFTTYRSDVCERVVKGTREVTATEPIVTGHREFTRTVEDVEWVCKPILAEVTA